ncbi:MAG: anaerobic glycerol-3-phosphate dehydrogenase subunit C [Planctomycetales bacterium]|nr:anaerobic glycerol-3-phosphate dehydrogenase subunit C [Planctomycetales bacterium]
MDPEQSRIQADLRGLVEGDVFCDPYYSQLYASDASIYEIRPLGVARPRSTRDVTEILRYCQENELSVFPRGGGSGLAGQSLGRGLIIDCSRYMRRIRGPESGLVRVQCGVVQADLNRFLGEHNQLFGPDPATRSVSSIGSMISVDAAGSHFPKYGSTGDCVHSLQVVLASGELVELGTHDWASDEAADSREGQIAQQVGLLLQQRSGLLMRPPWAEVARGCGYRVEKVLDGEQVNLARLMSGAEGTLGVITEATLRVENIPRVRGLMLLFFGRLDTAAKAALDLAREDLAACDLMDRRLLEIARETEPVYATIIPRGAEAMLLVEMQGDDPLTVRNRLMQLLQKLQKRGKPVVSYRLTTDSQERNLLWRLARRVIPRLYRLKGNLRPLPFVEDISVPPKRLPEFLRVVQDVLKTERVTATMFAHALHGQVDVRPFLDLASAKDQLRLAQLSDTLYRKVIEFGGCVSGEQAFGLSRAAWAESQLGDRLELCRKIKQVFDPVGIMNPGKFLSPTPPKVAENLRQVPQYAPMTFAVDTTSRISLGNEVEAASAFFQLNEDIKLDGPSYLDKSAAAERLLNTAYSSIRPSIQSANGETELAASATVQVPDNERAVGRDHQSLPLLLNWDSQSVGYTARSCNGCGRCRTSASAERMCPMFRVHHGEEASPRAKANLVRGILTGALDQSEIESREIKAISDLCFNCHQCRLECPASVNIPKLVQEAKAQHVASHGLPLTDRLLNRLDLLAAMGSRVANVANWSLNNTTMRWLLEKTFGIAQGRKLPKLSGKTFLRWAVRERLNRIEKSAGRKVAIFVDQYVNWHNPLLGQALVEVLRHQRVEIYVPTAQTPSWMAMIAAGDVARAKKLMQTNVKTLSEAVRQGYDIVTTEPSAALCLREEYRHLMQNEDTELIANHTYEISSYLWHMHGRNELELDFRPVNLGVVYHQPCHARVLDAGEPALNLMRLIPGLQIQIADDGCSGMAGTFGLQRKNFRTSIRIGRGLVNTMKDSRAQLGATECTACKLQMEQATSRPTVHPVALLAFAYGRVPQLAAWFSSRNEGKLVT